MGPWEPNPGSGEVQLPDRSLTCSDWYVLHLIRGKVLCCWGSNLFLINIIS